MITIEVDNSESKISGLSIEQHKTIKQVLSYFTAPPNSYIAKQFGVKKVSLLTKTGVFPTGLLTKVVDSIPGCSIVDIRTRPRQNIPSIKMTEELKPYPEQLAIVASCIKHNRGIVSAVTGFGKSITMGILVNHLKLKTLIVVPNLELKKQLTQSFSEWFPTLDNITIENIDSSRLPKPVSYDCLIIDEAHHVAASTYRKLNKTVWKGIYHRYFFTATPYRSIKEEQMLFESIAGQVIHEVKHDLAVSKGYVVPLEAYYLDVPKTKTTGNTWAKVYSDLVVNNCDRNNLVAMLLNSLKSQKKYVLCLVKEIKHGEILADLTETYFANGQDDNSTDRIKEFSRGKLLSLIGTTGVLSEGVDTKPAEYIIIAGLGKSKPAFMQACGRGFRNWPGKTSCKILIFKDTGNKSGKNSM